MHIPYIPSSKEGEQLLYRNVNIESSEAASKNVARRNDDSSVSGNVSLRLETET